MAQMALAHAVMLLLLGVCDGIALQPQQGQEAASKFRMNQMNGLQHVARRRNRTVVIQGVLHGAASSASAVQAACDIHDPSVVVLELCPERYRSMLSDATLEVGPTLDATSEASKVVTGARAALERKGPGAGATALVLGSLYAVSRAVGFRPGVEFLVPIRWATRQGVDVVLGDREISETFASVFRGADVEYFSGLRQGLETLRTAFLGRGEDSISLVRAVWTEADLRKELAALASAVAVAAGSLEVALASVFGHFASTSRDDPVSFAVSLAALLVSLDVLGRIGANVIDARDAVLADATAKAVRDAPESSTVLVVVGALHVNGIARRLGDSY